MLVSNKVYSLFNFSKSASKWCFNSSVFRSISSISRSVFSKAFNTIQNHPWIALSSVAICLGSYSYWILKDRESYIYKINKLVRDVEVLIKNRADKTIEESIKSIIETYLISACDKTIKNIETENYLSTKALNLAYAPFSEKSKKEILVNVFENFNKLIDVAHCRLKTDVESGVLTGLGVNKAEEVVKITPLGLETHNRGKIPLKITFSNGIEIVYKPRSMLPERLICDPENGALSSENFGVYKIIDLQDVNGEAYGYSEFLKNLESENVVYCKKDLVKYIEKFCILNKLSMILGITDLHFLNIITMFLEPFIVDAEAFSNPPNTETLIFDKVSGPLHLFEWPGGQEELMGSNKFWIDKEFAKEFDIDFSNGVTYEGLQKIGIDLEKMKEEVCLSEKTLQAIEQVKGVLSQHNGRFILANTREFSGQLENVDPNNPDMVRIFAEEIKRFVVNKDFVFMCNDEELLLEYLKQDVSNNDVPMFHYDSREKQLIYIDLVIGQLKER
ncbi:MAG: hypothetical protein ChlgKO_11080 [Chlamydiales bacterium]